MKENAGERGGKREKTIILQVVNRNFHKMINIRTNRFEIETEFYLYHHSYKNHLYGSFEVLPPPPVPP